MQGAGGMHMYSPDYLREVRALCDEHGAPLLVSLTLTLTLTVTLTGASLLVSLTLNLTLILTLTGASLLASRPTAHAPP